MRQQINRWLRFHAPYLPKWLPKGWRGRYYAWKFITHVQPAMSEITYGEHLWELIKRERAND